MNEETKSTRHPKKAAEAKPTVEKKKPAVKHEAPQAVEEKSGQREREGVVLSDKMQKTIIVKVVRLTEHPQFKKVIRRNVKYAVHDEKNEAKAGDKVRIVETRPLSKNKRWRLVQVLEKVSK